MSEALCKMRGAALKLGQVLSIQEENLIPSYIRNAFDKARDSSYKMPEGQFERLMTNELGENWRSKTFKEFNQDPFAAASIGQVHKGSCTVGIEEENDFGASVYHIDDGPNAESKIYQNFR